MDFSKKLAISLFLSFVSIRAGAANFVFESNAFYISDGEKVTATTTETKMLMDFALLFTLDRRYKWQIGWNYSIHSVSESGETSSKYSANEMGPKFGYFFDKNRTWGASLAYNLIVNGQRTTNGTQQKWRGSSIRFDAGYGAQVTEDMRLGLRLVYNMTTFNEEVDETTLTKISYSRTLLYPAIHFSAMF